MAAKIAIILIVVLIPTLSFCLPNHGHKRDHRSLNNTAPVPVEIELYENVTGIHKEDVDTTNTANNTTDGLTGKNDSEKKSNYNAELNAKFQAIVELIELTKIEAMRYSALAIMSVFMAIPTFCVTGIYIYHKRSAKVYVVIKESHHNLPPTKVGKHTKLPCVYAASYRVYDTDV